MEPVTIFETREQEPLLGVVSLADVPYTGFEASAVVTIAFYFLLAAWALYLTYLLVIRRGTTEPVTEKPVSTNIAPAVMVVENKALLVPTAVAADVTTVKGTAPGNLPVAPGTAFVPLDTDDADVETVVTKDSHVTMLENLAHAHHALLSTDAVRYFMGTVRDDKDQAGELRKLIDAGKKQYPLENGWLVLNEARMKQICTTCAEVPAKETFTPTIVAEGAGSLAEAIATANNAAVFAMATERPMFALADAAADFDAVYRQRQGKSARVSDLLAESTAGFSDEQLHEIMDALTAALDGTYDEEAKAVRMSLVKALAIAGRD